MQGLNNYGPQSDVAGTQRAAAFTDPNYRQFTGYFASDADGRMAPAFFILKAGSVRSDQSSVRLLHYIILGRKASAKFPARPATLSADEWQLKLWKETVTVLEKKSGIRRPILFKRWYLQHVMHGHVITTQAKGWMDTVGFVMMAQVMLGPYWRGSFGGRAGLGNYVHIVDNCGCHKSQEVINAWHAEGITLKFLPPNMTDQLQPMDLAVNKPMKDALRKFNNERSFELFQTWRAENAAAVAANVPYQRFHPFAASSVDGVKTMCAKIKEMREDDSFQAGLARVYVRAGLVRGPDGRLAVYRDAVGGEAGFANPEQVEDDGLLHPWDLFPQMNAFAGVQPDDADEFEEGEEVWPPLEGEWAEV